MGERLTAERRRILLQTVAQLWNRQGGDAHDAGGCYRQQGTPSYRGGFRCGAWVAWVRRVDGCRCGAVRRRLYHGHGALLS